MSADNYYLVRPATRKEKKAAGITGEAYTVEQRFASCEYVPGERNRAHYLSRELDDAIAWACNEYSEYGSEVESDLSVWTRLIAPTRVWVRDTKMRVWYWRRRYRVKKPSRWGRVRVLFRRELIVYRAERQLRRFRHAMTRAGWGFEEVGKEMAYTTKSVARLGNALAMPVESCGCIPSNLDDIGKFDYDYDDWHDASGCASAQATREQREREAGTDE